MLRLLSGNHLQLPSERGRGFSAVRLMILRIMFPDDR